LLSPADMLIIGAAALLFFGPDQLPKVALRAGKVMRDVQNTSQAFIREMERAADEPDHPPSQATAAPREPTPAAGNPPEEAAGRDSYEI
jgi:Sec-independent protein translocase protein TatA